LLPHLKDSAFQQFPALYSNIFQRFVANPFLNNYSISEFLSNNACEAKASSDKTVYS
jgi:hypothetical protein